MRLLVDNQLPIALARWFVAMGLDAVHVVDLDLGSASDLEIWNFARRLEMAIVTKDDDFRILANQQRSIPPQVIWIRLGNCRKQALLDAMTSVLPQLIAALSAGEPLIEIR